ncbi:MAG: SUMF1/EgtB/PvdO family nonheme iron enzyme [Bacteroidetes bacterium]|jgi:formylglycine-generating enzyme required for sulfatase activity|nr:SUMF1/EgtB/PvdO family nonheme iron enzyme [Bacteroidota bacterium]
MNSFLNSVLVNPNEACSPEGIEIEISEGIMRAPQFVDLRTFGFDFAVAKYPITNSVFDFFSQQNRLIKLSYRDDTRFNPPTHPVVGVNQKNASSYCEWLSGRLCLSVDLPDVFTWECIAKCGTEALYSTPDGSCTGDYMNFGLALGGTNPVDHFPSNNWGVHDMSGNVLEWTGTVPDYDQIRPELGAKPVETEADLQKLRILKGGCWAFDDVNSRISANIVLGGLSTYYIIGFRPIIHLKPD